MWIRRYFVSVLVLSMIIGGWFILHGISSVESEAEGGVEAVLKARQAAWEAGDEDPFGEDGRFSVLLLGLDTRTNEDVGHCDAIQFIEIDREASSVKITAVPRGTWALLPPGEHLPSDYYVSKSCEVGGLAYGIEQIERILGAQPDALVVVGMSQALGVFRALGLPTTETLQWLRHRQGFAIGEPQRAHNHSMFLKGILTRFSHLGNDPASIPLGYVLYTQIETDLTFAQARGIANALSLMELQEHPERITLSMKPSYAVMDLTYDPMRLDEDLATYLVPVAERLGRETYSGRTLEETQTLLITYLRSRLDDEDFVSEAVARRLWLSVEDRVVREELHYELLTRELGKLEEEARIDLLTDYILEMETLGEEAWAQRGRELLSEFLSMNAQK